MQACNETVNIQGERRVPFSAAFMRLAAVTAGLSAPAAAAAGTYTQIYTSVATTAEPRVAFFSPAGVLYGTTMPATASRTDTATIFALTPPQNGGSWSYATLYQFKAKCKCNVILTAQDDAGNVYGNTTGRLRSIAETLFKFNLASKKLTTLYTFPEDTGGYGPVLASDGDLYFSLGLTIYQLSTKGKLTSFYTFAGSNQSEPTISQDGNGNLLGEIAVNQTAAPVSVYELNIARKSLVFQTKALSEKVAAGITAFIFR